MIYHDGCYTLHVWLPSARHLSRNDLQKDLVFCFYMIFCFLQNLRWHESEKFCYQKFLLSPIKFQHVCVCNLASHVSFSGWYLTLTHRTCGNLKTLPAKWHVIIVTKQINWNQPNILLRCSFFCCFMLSFLAFPVKLFRSYTSLWCTCCGLDHWGNWDQLTFYSSNLTLITTTELPCLGADTRKINWNDIYIMHGLPNRSIACISYFQFLWLY